jgi:cytochrome c oxidase subunit 1
MAHVPVVHGLTPMWDDAGRLDVMDGLRPDRREVLVTSVTDAIPLYRQKSAAPSIWPLLAALAVSAMFIGSIFTPWAIVVGAAPVAATLTGWFWPSRPRSRSGPLGVNA